MTVFESHLAGLTESACQRIARCWNLRAGSPDRLIACFRDPRAVRTVLLGLEGKAVRLLLALLDAAEPSLTRRQLASYSGLPLAEADAALTRLEEYALALVMKNRARLDDSADRIHRNPLVCGTLLGGAVPAAAPLLVRDSGIAGARLSLPCSLQADLESLAALCGGVVPEALLEGLCTQEGGEMPCRQTGDPVLLLLGDRFVAARRFSLPPSAGEPRVRHGYRGMAQLAALLGDLRSRPLAVTSEAVVRRRDLERLARRTGIDFADFGENLSFLLRCGVMRVRGGELCLNRKARRLLAVDLDGRLSMLARTCRVRAFLKGFSGSPHLFPETTVNGIADYQIARQRLVMLAEGLRGFSRLGMVALRIAGDRVVGWRLRLREPCREKQNGSFSVDGSWGIHLRIDALAAWERYYLFLACDLKSRGELITLQLTEKSWFRGISLGLDPARLVSVLERGAGGRLPDTLRFAIADWEAALGRARVRRVFLLEADARTIEIFEHDRRLSGFIERIGDGFLVLSAFDERRLFTLLAEHRILLEYMEGKLDG